MIYKNYLNVLVEQLFVDFLILHYHDQVVSFKKFYLYLKDAELFLGTLSGFPVFVLR